ncbi:MAG: TIGR02117 family protein [Gammaproteobacteria bacterium]|nr:TIGR02117 family protein [Gammaproteobacteria bacterium]
MTGNPHSAPRDRPTAHSFRKRCARTLRRIARVVLIAIALYLVIVLIGLIPVNNDFKPTPDGIEILLVSSPVHADVALPIETETINWREFFPAHCFSGDTSDATHVTLGWGDKAFFLETPTWAEFRVSTTAKALFWPSDSCIHVYSTKAESLRDGSRSVRISVAQYERLVEHVKASFKQEADGSRVQIGNAAYGSNDAFFEARGAYHCFNTCNCWVGRAMQSAGIKTGCFTPLPKTVFLYLPE